MLTDGNRRDWMGTDRNRGEQTGAEKNRQEHTGLDRNFKSKKKSIYLVTDRNRQEWTEQTGIDRIIYLIYEFLYDAIIKM